MIATSRETEIHLFNIAASLLSGIATLVTQKKALVTQRDELEAQRVGWVGVNTSQRHSSRLRD